MPRVDNVPRVQIEARRQYSQRRSTLPREWRRSLPISRRLLFPRGEGVDQRDDSPRLVHRPEHLLQEIERVVIDVARDRPESVPSAPTSIVTPM